VPFDNEGIIGNQDDPLSDPKDRPDTATAAAAFSPRPVSTSSKVGFDRIRFGDSWSVVAAVSEAVVLTLVLCAAISVFRRMTGLGGASWLMLFGLPVFNLLIQARRRVYDVNHLLYAPIQFFRLLGGWIEAFGAAVLAATLVRCIEPWRLRHIGMFAPEVATLFGVGFVCLVGLRLMWAIVRPRFAAAAVPRVLFVGAIDGSRRLLAQLRGEPSIRLVGSLDSRDPAIMPFGDVPDGDAGGRMFADMLRRDRIDAVLLAMPQLSQGEINGLATVARACGVKTLALPGIALRRDAGSLITGLGGLHVLRSGSDRPARFALAQKRALDLVLGIGVLIAIAPVMAVIALLIRLDSRGPVLFRQVRVGRDGALFEILKFRTMVHRAPAFDPATGSLVQTARNDPRVTRIGALLRRHSLDELPQIFNVLRGEMSIVGPRPHAAAMTVEGQALEALLPEYPDRFAMRPGITGWAQVNGQRGIIDDLSGLQARTDLDLYYVENWSPGFDISILIRTILCLIRDDRAF
jgi:exopolysaccharide biosynthesis polyprenyl glycosylphosphotransferase